MSCGTTIGVLNRDCVGTCSQVVERAACSKVHTVFGKRVRRSSASTRDYYAAGRAAEAGNIGLRTNRGTKGCGRLCDCDWLGRGATIGIINRDCVGTGRQAAESTTRTKGSAIDRVSVRRSSTRTRDCYTPGRIAKAGNISLRTNRRAKRCGGLGDCDRLSRGTTIGVLDRDCVGTCGQVAESTAVAEGGPIDRVSIRRSSTRACDRHTPG